MPSLKYVLARIDLNALLTDAEKDIRKEDARERHREYVRRYMAKRRASDPEFATRERVYRAAHARAARAQVREETRAELEARAARDAKLAARRAEYAAKRAAIKAEQKAQESQRIAETLRALPPMESDAKIAERLADLRELHVARLELRGRAAELRCELAAGKITRAQAREAAERIQSEIARVEAPMLAQRRALGLPEVLDGDGAAERSEGQEALRGPKVHTTGGRRMGARHGTHGVTRGIQKKATATAKEAIK